MKKKLVLTLIAAGLVTQTPVAKADGWLSSAFKGMIACAGLYVLTDYIEGYQRYTKAKYDAQSAEDAVKNIFKKTKNKTYSNEQLKELKKQVTILNRNQTLLNTKKISVYDWLHPSKREKFPKTLDTQRHVTKKRVARRAARKAHHKIDASY